jgi:hypothetical protein
MIFLQRERLIERNARVNFGIFSHRAGSVKANPVNSLFRRRYSA